VHLRQARVHQVTGVGSGRDQRGYHPPDAFAFSGGGRR
jgi:hypothetical protein